MVKEKLKQILASLNDGIYEKEKALGLALLASLAGESIFLLGPPGVAKSLVARRLKHAYQGAKCFEYLMSRFSTPDEVFGPISIKQLKENDQYTRLTENYLPGSQIVFLDEIWKASPPIQNALLTALNEKIYRNGEKEIAIDLRGLIAASNELPSKEEGLEALWDRFLIRLVINGIEERTNFDLMIADARNLYQDSIPEAQKIQTSEYQSWTTEINKIQIPAEILDIIDLIRKALVQRNQSKKSDEQIIISDRRWKKIVRLLRSCAFANDRTEIDLMDCFLIAECLWDQPEQEQEVWDLVRNIIQQHGYRIGLPVQELAQEIQNFNQEVNEETHYEKKKIIQVKKVYDGEKYKVVNIEPCYITIEDLKKIEKKKKDQHQIIMTSNSYGGNYRYCRYVSETSIQISDSTYSFELEDQETKEISTKKPHAAVKQQWDDIVEQLLKECQTLLDKVEEYKQKDGKHVTSNLFVSAQLAQVVFANLDQTVQQVQKLKLEIGKIQHYYANLQ